jgi:hypothetical protein
MVKLGRSKHRFWLIKYYELEFKDWSSLLSYPGMMVSSSIKGSYHMSKEGFRKPVQYGRTEPKSIHDAQRENKKIAINTSFKFMY